jgi:hypothetical protein
MPIRCSGSKRGSASLSPWVLLYGLRDDGCGMMVKGNDGGRWSFDGVEF